MTSSSWYLLGGALFLIGGCSSATGSDAEELAGSSPEVGVAVSAAPGDLADGAFERVDGSGADGSVANSSAGGQEEAAASSTPVSDDGSISSVAPGGTTADGQPADPSDVNSTTSTPGAEEDETTTTTESSPPTSAADQVPGQGVVKIGDISYPFVAEDCVVEDGNFSAAGFGVSTDGAEVEVSLILELLDIDGDGDDDFSFDIAIEPDAGLDVDLDTLPDFYAIKVESSDFNQGADINVTLEGLHIFGSGPIEDFNGVAIPDGESRPMTFDAQCN